MLAEGGGTTAARPFSPTAPCSLDLGQAAPKKVAERSEQIAAEGALSGHDEHLRRHTRHEMNVWPEVGTIFASRQGLSEICLPEPARSQMNGVGRAPPGLDAGAHQTAKAAWPARRAEIIDNEPHHWESGANSPASNRQEQSGRASLSAFCPTLPRRRCHHMSRHRMHGDELPSL